MVELRTPSEGKLRVLHVLRAGRADVLRHVVDLSLEQIRRGHEVGLVVDREEHDAASASLLIELTPQLTLGIERVVTRGKLGLADLATIARVGYHIRRVKPDVVHGHGFKGGLYAHALRLRRGNGRPLRCYAPHDDILDRAGLARRVVEGTLERVLAAGADALIFETVHLANACHERFSDAKATMRIVPHGIATELFQPVTPDSGAADFLYVGGSRDDEGLETLIDAVAIAQRRVQRPVSLALAGVVSRRAMVEARVQMRGIRENVRFVGDLPPRRAFALGRTLVVPGRQEAACHLVLEAAGARRTVIAADIGVMSEVFGPYRDRLVPSRDPIALSRALECSLESVPEHVVTQTQDFAAYVAARFTREVMASGVLETYVAAFARRMPTPHHPTRAVSFSS